MFTPPWFVGYQRKWFTPDVIAGVTLAAVAIPEVLGYTSISQTPLVTGLYTIIFPTTLFALLGASKLLVVGADSATAAILSAGLISAGFANLVPGSQEWVALCSLTALVCGAMLLLARLLRLGFLGDFLSASVLIGFLTGVGVQVLTGQIPSMLGVSKGTGNWLSQQWHWITEIPDLSWATFGFALGALVIIRGFRRFAPRVPGALIAVVLLTAISAATDAKTHGVAVVGALNGGFPPIGLPSGLTWSDVPKVLGVAFSCFVLIIAQSAATSRSFAMKHGDRADVNRDIIGLAGANVAAGLTGTFVVNGSPTKTQILDEQKGRSQISNLTLAVITLGFTLWLTGLLADMPKSVLGAIVFLIGYDLIDIRGLRHVLHRRRSEFVIAAATAVIVCVFGVEAGIIVAIAASIIEIIRRQYSPRDFVVSLGPDARSTFAAVTGGAESAPGLIVFRYDAALFYANANRFIDDVETLVEQAAHPVRWLVVDASSITDIDYSAGEALSGLLDFLDARDVKFATAGADSSLLWTLARYHHLQDRLDPALQFPDVASAVQAWQADSANSPHGTEQTNV